MVPFEVWAERLGRAPESIVKLDANENPYGPSPRALEVLSAAKSFNIYPDPGSTLLAPRAGRVSSTSDGDDSGRGRLRRVD